jgi:hypothetical protein
MLCVQLPDGSDALVPMGDEEGSEGELNQLEMSQDPDQSLGELQANLAEEGKPRA